MTMRQNKELEHRAESWVPDFGKRSSCIRSNSAIGSGAVQALFKIYQNGIQFEATEREAPCPHQSLPSAAAISALV
jgi:hypothetical protein